MSSFRALLSARADLRLSSLRTLSSISASQQISPGSAHFRFNSSTASNPAQDAESEKSRIAKSVEKLMAQKNESPRAISDLKKRSQKAERVMKGGPWFVKKEWKLDPEARGAGVKIEDGFIRVGSQKVPNIWLRDNCQCSSCVHQETKQRLLDTFSIPENISIKSCRDFEAYMDVTWSDGHRSRYEKGFLRDASSSSVSRAKIRQGNPAQIKLWGSAAATKARPSVPFREQAHTIHDDMIEAVLHKIRVHGFCYVADVPPTPEATEALLRRIAFIRETHYGGFYDFTADLALADTAYTNIALGAHTDNTYFSDPAGLQAFHLLSHTEGSGGASLLVDGFKAAQDLLDEDMDAYNVLATTNVHGHASGNDGISIQPYRGFPVLEHDVETGALLRVRWNVSDRAAIELPLDETDMWYAAARKFDTILKRQENEYWEQLQPGSVLIFDNWRVLHGRSEFTGKRRICGGYINRDDWISKFKMLHFGKEEVMGRLASG